MTKEYEAFIEVGKQGLADNVFWCIIDPDGEPMLDTKSKRFDTPVITFCNALQCEWDDATEAGYRLGQCTLPNGYNP